MVHLWTFRISVRTIQLDCTRAGAWPPLLLHEWLRIATVESSGKRLESVPNHSKEHGMDHIRSVRDNVGEERIRKDSSWCFVVEEEDLLQCSVRSHQTKRK